MTVTLIPTPPYPSTILADSPLAYWRLDETSGTVAHDQLLIHNVTYLGGPTLGQPGALVGDPDLAITIGNNEYVSVPYNANLNPSVFSVEIWGKPTSGPSKLLGLMASRKGNQGWALYVGTNNTWQFVINNGASTITVSGGSVKYNVWPHLVATFDGKTALLYVNGNLTGSGSTSAAYQPQTSNVLTIGQGEPNQKNWFRGSLDEPAVYSTVLSASRIQKHYGLGSSGH